MNKIAAIQMASGPNIQANLDEAGKLIDSAVTQGAGLIVLPENFALMSMTEAERVVVAEKEGQGVMQDFLAAQAQKNSIWIVGGTVPIKTSIAGKARAACFVLNDQGESVARYDKIHMFDVHIQDTGERYTESETTDAGNETIVIDTPFGCMGLAVCYDLRFPEMFRSLSDQGMELCVMPSAFTAITGKYHWEALVRARAIENQCYMLASNQGGFHTNGRETYGDSMVVDPWGNILDRLPSGSGVVIAEMDAEFLSNTRKNFPVLEHRRLNCKIN